MQNLEIRRQRGIVPPKFVFPLVLESSRGIISGAPFDAAEKPSTLLEDFAKKLAKIPDADAATRISGQAGFGNLRPRAAFV